jgi:hypothetical protein
VSGAKGKLTVNSSGWAQPWGSVDKQGACCPVVLHAAIELCAVVNLCQTLCPVFTCYHAAHVYCTSFPTLHPTSA